MTQLMALYNYLMTNGPAMMAAFGGLWAFLEVVVRLTPTTKDDTLLAKVGSVLKSVFDALKIPNNIVVTPAAPVASEEKKAS